MDVFYVLIVLSLFVLSPNINMHTLLILKDVVHHAATHRCRKVLG